jgi:adenylate cyclase
MEIPRLLVAGAGLALLLLAGLLWRARAEAARLAARLEAASMQLERLQISFSRFAPEELVEQIIASGLPTAGEKKEVTVLFADLVGFTVLSESVDPSVLVGILNGYFERMSRAITDHRGHVSTFIGDGILALFGALAPNPWQGNDALHAALAMRGALAAYNRELEAQGLPQLSIGVGLHRGVGIAGLVGSEELKEFAIVGRTVNVAARVQDLTRVHGVDVLLTEEVRETLDPRFALRPLPPAELRGIAKPVPVFAAERFAG